MGQLVGYLPMRKSSTALLFLSQTVLFLDIRGVPSQGWLSDLSTHLPYRRRVSRHTTLFTGIIGHDHRAAVFPVPSASPWRLSPPGSRRSSGFRPRGSACACSRAAWSPCSVESRTTPSPTPPPPGRTLAVAHLRARVCLPFPWCSLPRAYKGFLLRGREAPHNHADHPRVGPLVPHHFYRNYRTSPALHSAPL